MSDAIAHRGPDAQGTWNSPPDERGRGVMLAHRRLSILDLSPAGAQPMHDPVTGDVIVFNGEIYNYVELRERQIARGQKFESSGDTQVMLRALAVDGPQSVADLRGMFTFAFWDKDERRLLLARDPLGIKPLYLARNPDRNGSWSLAFCSELRGLLATGLLGKPRLDFRAVASMVWNGFVAGPNTMVEGVELVWPGQLLGFDSAGRQIEDRRFWNIRPPQTPASEEELAAGIEETVRLHLASDVPLAIFLSAGIDSSAMANLAQRAAKSKVHTFTLAFEDQKLNEGPPAREIARAIGTEHTEVMLTEAEFLADLERAVDSVDQPSFDGTNAYFMSKAIRKAGFTVAISGTGGDELFGGYPTYRQLPKVQETLRSLRLLPRGPLVALAKLATLPLRVGAGPSGPQTGMAKAPALMQRGDDPIAAYQVAYALFVPQFQEKLIGPLTALARDGLPLSMHDRLEQEIAGRTPIAQVSILEQRLFLGERLLRDNDAASMAVSLEQRVPLVDSKLHELVDRLPDGPRFFPLGRKEILRRVGLRGLDPALFTRPKSGFVLPFDRWIRAGLKPEMDKTFSDESAVRAAGLDPKTVGVLWRSFIGGEERMYWSRVWALYVLIRWCQRHGVSA